MATGTLTDFVVNPVFFRLGMLETLGQNGILFNGATRNTILFSVERIIGQITNEDFFKRVANLIQDRDPSSVAAVADTKIEQDTKHAIKVDKRIGPVAQTLDAFRKIGATEEEISFNLGRQVGEEVAQDYFNAALLSVRAALTNVGASNSLEVAAAGGANPMITDYLRQALAKLGDAADRVLVWVMHSKVWWDLVGDQIENYPQERVAGVILYGASPATFGRPVIVSDSTSLTYQEDLGSGLEDVYETLGLVQGAAEVVEAEFEDPITERKTGQENLIWRFQGEYAFYMRIQGASWNEGSGGLSPVTSALGTAANWDQVFTNHKDLAGVRIKTN